jgi:hypothetical protein
LLFKFNFKAGLALLAALAAIAVIAPAGASARCTTGGMSAAAIDVCTPTAKAKLLPSGELIPPKSAPPRVKAVIAAANKIRTKPYIYGGGHAKWNDRGYDCSGSVSFALHGGNLLKSPLPSGSLESWSLDHRLRQRRPRLRRDRRRPPRHLGRRKRRNRASLAPRPARQHRLRRAAPGGVLRLGQGTSWAGWGVF